MAKSSKQATWPVVLLLILAAVLWLKDHRRDLGAVVVGEETAAIVDDRFDRLDGCRWVPSKRNDGDSFRVKLPDGRTEELRLYFVDAPESAFKSYGGGRNNHERIADQARDLNLSSEQAVEIGVAAKAWVHQQLSRQPFTIFTAWDDPFRDKRYHAFIAMPGGGWLHEALVSQGLVRLHTKGEDLPGGRRRDAQKRHLQELEAQAQRDRQGAWAK